MPQPKLTLREVVAADLPVLYRHQLDPIATEMAAFPSRDWEKFQEHWGKIMTSPTGVLRTILLDGAVAGYIASWQDSGETLAGYWIGREYWGKGVATAALSAFLEIVPDRPVTARVAKHNAASVRVLEKCGFMRAGEDELSDPDGAPVVECIMKFESRAGRELSGGSQ